MLTRIRDLISTPLTDEYLQQRQAQGWVLAAIEWVKEAETNRPAAELSNLSAGTEDLPYGLRVHEDCTHLTRDPQEMHIVEFIFEKVVAGWRPPQIAEELNVQGRKTRQQKPWTSTAVFELLPRLIELSPGLLKRPDWSTRRKELQITP